MAKQKRASRHAHRLCPQCGEQELAISTTAPSDGDHQTAYLLCGHCLAKWKVEEPLRKLINRCKWRWVWAGGYGRQSLSLEYDGWPIDVQSRYLCIRKLDDRWGRGTDPAQLDRHGRGWGRGDETGWFILTPDYLLLEKAATQHPNESPVTPMDELIDSLFNERLKALRENDSPARESDGELKPVKARQKNRKKSQNKGK
ncbi:hypothetical protein [Halomonas sp.]|uniref:hypothetical protein n=1 Tax=Halomonas sp. TaxID=1486246 RepID=UPI003D0EBD57